MWMRKASLLFLVRKKMKGQAVLCQFGLLLRGRSFASLLVERQYVRNGMFSDRMKEISESNKTDKKENKKIAEKTLHYISDNL